MNVSFRENKYIHTTTIKHKTTWNFQFGSNFKKKAGKINLYDYLSYFIKLNLYLFWVKYTTMITLQSKKRLKKKCEGKTEVQSLQNLCLTIIAKLLELNDNEHDNSYNVLQALSPSLSLSSSLFNLLTKFNRSTLRHFSSYCSSFIQCLDLSNSRISNEVFFCNYK